MRTVRAAALYAPIILSIATSVRAQSVLFVDVAAAQHGAVMRRRDSRGPTMFPEGTLSELDSLREAVEARHGSKAAFFERTPISDVFRGRSVWKAP